MSDLKMGPVETRFAEIIWDREPVGSTELVRLAEEALGWKKSTTYTVLKRLISKGVLERSGTDFTVTPLVTRRQMQLVELNNLVEKRFGGSEAEVLEVLCRGGCSDPAHRAELVRVLDELR